MVVSLNGQATLSPRTKVVSVATTNPLGASTPDEILQCDRVLNGTADDIVINTLIASGVSLHMASGYYAFINPVAINGKVNVQIQADYNAKISSPAAVESFIITDSTNVTLEGLEIYNLTPATDPGRTGAILIVGSSHVNIRWNRIHDCWNAIWARCNLVTHVKTSGLTIEHNEFYNGYYMTMCLSSGVKWVDIHDNIIHDNGPGSGGNLYAISSTGVAIEDATSRYPEWVDVHDNIIINIGSGLAIGQGVDMHAGNHINIHDNTIDIVGGTAILLHALGSAANETWESWKITGNSINDCTAGIGAQNDNDNLAIRNVQINGNLITNWRSVAISIAVYNHAGDSMSQINICNNQISMFTGNVAATAITILGSSPNNVLNSGLIVSGNAISGKNEAYNGGTQIHATYSFLSRYFNDVSVIGNSWQYFMSIVGPAFTTAGVNHVISDNQILLCRNGVTGIFYTYGPDAVITDNTIRILAGVTGTTGIGCNDANVIRPLIRGNSLYGVATPISYAAAITPTIYNNQQINPVGLIANPVGAAHIGLNGAGATIVSATVYTVIGTDIWVTLADSAGADNAILIKDTAGNTFVSASHTLANQFIPRGYTLTVTFTGAAGAIVVFGN
jgi:hypothetical protein